METVIVIVEPHADDAYLSLGAHIEQWAATGERVLICTVFSATRHRGDEARAYAQAVGAEWAGLGYTESGVGTGTDQAFEFDTPPPIPGDPDDRVIFPLGLRHPEHRAVSALAPTGTERYVEVPYQISRDNEPELLALITGRQVTGWRKPTIRKWRFHHLFKDQGLFMRYNPPSRLAASIEVIVR